MTTSDTTHALYRFYDATGALLYIGITADPGSRWRKHAHDKPWWHEVANVTIETHHGGRQAVLDAERAAILTEHPRYNVIHNRGTADTPTRVPQLDRLAPFQRGDWAALGLHDGRCPIGEITALDDTWVTLRLKDANWGHITHRAIAIRWDEIARVELAYPEDADTNTDGVRIMDDEHLAHFQTAWRKVNLGDAHDPVEQARIDAIANTHERRNRRS